MTRIKVDGGTTPSTSDLCNTCSNAMRVSGDEGFERTFCSALDAPVVIPKRIHTCDRWHKRDASPSIYAMNNTAWYRIQLKDGRFTFATSYGMSVLQKRGLLFNEQEKNIEELLERLNVAASAND